jgi:septation ring formation regulator EzrA
MTPEPLQEILAAKRERRTRLANLPIDQKIDLIEKLHELGQTMVAARESLPAERLDSERASDRSRSSI